MELKMVDLKNQYLKIKTDIDKAIEQVLLETDFINGQKVKDFSNNLAKYLDVKHIIPCANGTDALQIAMMTLDFEIGDEIILPAFTYVATAEVVALLKLTPVLVDVDPNTFNIDISKIEQAITPKTKAIVPVHLYGQSAQMDEIMQIAQKHNLYVIEDNAQAIGAYYTNNKGQKKRLGTIGHIGCTSFFPTKNLGCYGDGGALMTNNDILAQKIKMIANHGQIQKYHHKYIGINSRLDTIQAAILDEKLKYLDNYSQLRFNTAMYYSEGLKDIEQIQVPYLAKYSSHVFHQYTIIIKTNQRDQLKEYLQKKSIPSMIYYPLPLNEQEAFKNCSKIIGNIENTYMLCKSVLSLPMHTELNKQQQDFIISTIKEFFKK